MPELREIFVQRRRTVLQNSHKLRRKYRAVRSFACTAHSFFCSALLASLARSTVLIHSLARSLTHSRAREKVNDQIAIFAVFISVLDHSARARFHVFASFRPEEEKEKKKNIRIHLNSTLNLIDVTVCPQGYSFAFQMRSRIFLKNYVRPSVRPSRVIFEGEKYAYQAHLVPCIRPCFTSD